MKHRTFLNRISIKWRIFACLVIFAAVILGFLWIFQVSFLDTFYQNIKIKEIKSSAQEIQKKINESGGSGEEFHEALARISQQKLMCILVTDEMGYVIDSHEAVPNCIIHRMNTPMLIRAYLLTDQNGGSYLERSTTVQWKDGQIFREDPNQPETMIYTNIFYTKEGQVRFVLLNTALSPVNATVQTLRVQLIWITVIMVVLALLIAFFLSRRISLPIIKINRSAKALGSGNYQVTFDENGYQEISELARTLNYAARELSKVENLQRELIANISHDLRTPLTMITGYSEVMRDLPGENTPENVQVIIDEAKRLTTLVNDVLDISKLQSGTQTLNRTDFSLTESIRNILERYTKLVDYNISFLAPQDVWVYADELKISQVIYNLINNAITHTGPDKKVTITQTLLSGSPQRVRIEVTDTGEGLEEDKLQDIWERYYKVDKTHKRAQVGTGLGLSIVKTVLDLHGGASYGVNSTLGHGSTFWFELPAKEHSSD